MEAAPAEDAAPKAKGRAKVQRLLDIETQVQLEWAQQKMGQAEPAPGKPKYMATFPYPYMNGKLHIGHAFTVTKAEFAARYKKLRGFNVLFPFGFHCTGMPIAACADKLKRELKLFGNPPIFPPPPAEPVEEQPKVVVAAQPGKFSGKKTKVAQKAGPAKTQWEILSMLGIPDKDIPEFQNSDHWLQFFPPPAKDHLIKFGCLIDWRRSFITTEVNPYYDSFIRWQFNTLHAMEDKLVFGNRPSIYSTVEQQQCADHDRSQGEGVGPQEYTIIKIQVAELTGKLAELEGKMDVYLAAATLRPETMFGQTNCWILPWGEYGVWEMADGHAIVASKRSALNMSYQGGSKHRGKPHKIMSITGQELIGVPLKAPLSPFEHTYCLPLLTIKMDKGTGVVTSVPSDSPADYIALLDLKNKPALREKYMVQDEWVLPFECVDIIDTPTFGSRAAEAACEQFKIKSQNDVDKLELAKAEVYKEGFYNGIMNGNCAEYNGMKVEDAKNQVRAKMIDEGAAFLYWEPENKVVSRSGVECVVALTDQWCLRYGEPTWRKQIEDHINGPYETFMKDTKNMFRAQAERLTEWGASRAYGLGTKLPFDKRFVIESLSDSTIYMAYYTIAHYLQSGPFDGSVRGSANIAAEDMTHAVWDFIFKNGEYPVDCKIPEETLAEMRAEFEYWYPLDLRVSGKDLIGNHLTFSLYHHAAIFPDKMPRSVFTNGFVQMDGQKMSKSEGNFLTLEESIEQYSADATRMALANAGDSNQFANFEKVVVNANILKLFALEEWASTVLADSTLREGPEMTWHDKMFAGDIEHAAAVTADHFDGMRFREGLKTGFYEFVGARERYRAWTGSNNMHRTLVERYMKVQAMTIAPISPHVAEVVWKHAGGEGFCANASWPTELNTELSHAHRASIFLTKFLTQLRESVDKNAKAKKSVPKTKAMVYIAPAFSEVQVQVLTFLKDLHDQHGDIPADYKAGLQAVLQEKLSDKKAAGVALGFAAYTAKNCEEQGPHVLDVELPFNQSDVILSTAEFIRSEMGLELEMLDAAEVMTANPKNKKAPGASPGAPTHELA